MYELKNTRLAKASFCGILIAGGTLLLYQASLLPWP